MLATIRTLLAGANARAEENLRDHYSVELIDQKIRDSKEALKSAKLALASLIQRQRNEHRQLEILKTRAADLTNRASEALVQGREDLATDAAQAIADMENEMTVRQSTLLRLDRRVLQLRQSVETGNRRIVDLTQGATAARAIKQEQGIQRRMSRHLGGQGPIEEAEALIARVLDQDDPFEQAEILRDIDRGLDKSDLADRMSDSGFGPATRSTAQNVLSRLKSGN